MTRRWSLRGLFGCMVGRATPRRFICKNMAHVTRKKNPDAEPRKTCGECAHHYDEHSPALDGHNTLARCPYYTDGKYCVLMIQTACKEHFKAL